jgi:hypothetical protein
LYVECDCPESKDGGDALWDDTESHGVDHRHIDGMWMKPTENCYLQWLDCMPDAASDLATRADLGPGSYPVSFDYTGEGWYELELAPTKVRHG